VSFCYQTKLRTLFRWCAVQQLRHGTQQLTGRSMGSIEHCLLQAVAYERPALSKAYLFPTGKEDDC
jgi:hypothetical protein